MRLIGGKEDRLARGELQREWERRSCTVGHGPVPRPLAPALAWIVLSRYGAKTPTSPGYWPQSVCATASGATAEAGSAGGGAAASREASAAVCVAMRGASAVMSAAKTARRAALIAPASPPAAAAAKATAGPSPTVALSSGTEARLAATSAGGRKPHMARKGVSAHAAGASTQASKRMSLHEWEGYGPSSGL